ncbi:hypothetical protein H257_17250 [Aphanomyces astaci]|uniref:Uncharacterized protein n=1 Tax=Aphanomyces astaci TaxID=112090 RepID=W4FFI9_APHAT|nr:hypothetical protein H257_17250 [Aphanomyces astaci]ETV66282.1 hypothetical protein H257_17250 [Aphanomyces astaci]|eukprot:XP_009844269.1 hypothetical protein H257_17250 [Aphanomyces astaci]
MNLMHNHPLFQTKPTMKAHPGVSKSRILEALQKSGDLNAFTSDPRKLTGKQIISHYQRSSGEIISTSSASRAKQDLIQNLYGSVEVAFEKVAAYFELVKSRIPGTFGLVETRNGAFLRSTHSFPGFARKGFQTAKI